MKGDNRWEFVLSTRLLMHYSFKIIILRHTLYNIRRYVCNLYFYLLGKGGYVFGSVGLSVCLFVCEQHYSKSYERIGMKLYGRVLSSTSKN